MLQFIVFMPKLNLTRRQFFNSLVATGLVGLSATAGYAGLIEPFNYELTETDIFIHDLPARFEGFRLTQVTDVHHSRFVSLEEVGRVVKIAGETKPDMFALTGDYTTSHRHYVEPCAEVLGALTAPEGTWAVLGNHDHHTDAGLTTRALIRRGINVLENANTVLRRGADVLQLAGVDDWGWGKTDWIRALRGVDRTRPTVLLSHEPIVLDEPEVEGLSLIISGHTHGGQVALPFIGAPVRFMKEFQYLCGLYERAGTRLYVSRGTGMVGLPIRLGARPEIAVLRLRRAVNRPRA